MAKEGKSPEEIEAENAARIQAEWELIQRNAGTPGSVPVYKPTESKSEKAARTPGSKNPVYEELKKKYGW